LGPDPLTEALREKVREMILTLVEAERAEVLAAIRYERSESRRGYRHGSQLRSVTTGLGEARIAMPRARLIQDGRAVEWQSRLVPRYQRRATAVDAALLGAYLAGANTRRIKGALAPMLRGAPLSKSAISRLVGRLKSLFEVWRTQSLAEERIVVLYLDAIALRVRIAQKVSAVPVLVALGVRADGQKVVVALELLTSESTAAWGGLLAGLAARGLNRPRLCVIDGSQGLRAAVEEQWPGLAVQRCTVHKLRNLERHVPRHALEEVREDYHRIVYAESLSAARRACSAFVAKWETRAPKVATSLQEAGEELLTFYRFPQAQWKALRSTNAIERLNEEFRRRVKTQGSLPNVHAAELLLFGLLHTDQIRMRRMDGWRELDRLVGQGAQEAA
jgi:transposase-like protein